MGSRRGRRCGDLLLLLLSRELKYSLRSASRSFSLVGGVPSVDLDTGFLSFARQLMDDFPCGGVFALRACNLEVFHFFVQHDYFVWLVGLIQIGFGPLSSFSWLFLLGDQVPSFGFISLSVIHFSWIVLSFTQFDKPYDLRLPTLFSATSLTACSNCWYLWVIGADVSLHWRAWKLLNISSWNWSLTEANCSFCQLKFDLLRVSFWWLECCKQAKSWQSCDQNPALLNFKLCNSSRNYTTCCLSECSSIWCFDPEG